MTLAAAHLYLASCFWRGPTSWLSTNLQYTFGQDRAWHLPSSLGAFACTYGWWQVQFATDLGHILSLPWTSTYLLLLDLSAAHLFCILSACLLHPLHQTLSTSSPPVIAFILYLGNMVPYLPAQKCRQILAHQGCATSHQHSLAIWHARVTVRTHECMRLCCVRIQILLFHPRTV